MFQQVLLNTSAVNCKIWYKTEMNNINIVNHPIIYLVFCRINIYIPVYTYYNLKKNILVCEFPAALSCELIYSNLIAIQCNNTPGPVLLLEETGEIL